MADASTAQAAPNSTSKRDRGLDIFMFHGILGSEVSEYRNISDFHHMLKESLTITLLQTLIAHKHIKLSRFAGSSASAVDGNSVVVRSSMEVVLDSELGKSNKID